MIKRKDKILKVMKKSSHLNNLKKRDVMSASPDYYVHLDWSNKWKYKNK